MKPLGWLIILGLAAGGYYWYQQQHQPVTQLQPGHAYKLSGPPLLVAGAATLPGWSGTAITYSPDNTSAVMSATYNGTAMAVPYGLTATPA